MRIPESSLLSAPAAIFYTTWAEAHYRFSGSHSGAAAVAAIVTTCLLHASIAMWVVTDAQERAYPLPYDFASFVFIFGMIFGALYVFSTRGIRGFVPIVGLIGLTLAGAATGMCTYLAVWILRHLIT